MSGRFTGANVCRCLALLALYALFALPTQAQTFTDVAVSAGVAEGAGSAIYMAGAWGDYDGDGRLDLYVTNAGRFLTGRVTPSGYILADTIVAVPCGLYHNSGDGTFTNVAAGAGVTNSGTWVGGPSWGDYDNDGDLDLFVIQDSATGYLYRNNGNGTFTDVVARSGISGPIYSSGASWVDYNNDGWLDLFSPAMPAPDAQGNPDLTSPPSRLFRNNGDGTFTNVAARAGVNVFGNSCGIWGDYDNDGDMDLFMPTHATPNPKQHPNQLFRNNGDGTFTDVATSTGVVNPRETLSVSGAWGDCNNDGFLDLYVVNNDGVNQLFMNNGNGTFTETAAGAGVADSKTGYGDGAVWGDFDNDGFLDLYVVNIASSSPNRLFRNSGNGTFAEIGASAGVNLADGGGAACADYDGDGDLDIFLVYVYIDKGTPAGGPNRLYRNNGNTNRWLEINLIGARSNRSAIGARVTCVTGTLRQRRDVEPAGSGWGSQPSLPVEFGLAGATVVDSLIVRWPSGVVDILTGVSTNQILQVKEGMSRLLAGPVQTHRSTVMATVTRSGAPATGLELAFSRSISGLAPDYRWKGTTDASGRATIQIALDLGRNMSGYYIARAVDPATGAEIGAWSSIAINGGKEIGLSLPIGRKARITSEMPLSPEGMARTKPAITGDTPEVPLDFALQPSFPNPFNPATTIRYSLPEMAYARLTVYNLLGQHVRTLVEASQEPGYHAATWDGRDALGRPVSSGMYLYRLEAGRNVATQKMILSR